MDSCWLGLLQKYQTLVVGTLGFVGVILTMLANSRMQRKQHEREVQHEAAALRVALKTELRTNKQSFENRVEQFGESVGSFTGGLVPNTANQKIYDELIGRIGLLTEKEIEKVTEAYGLLAEIPYRLRILVRAEGADGLDGESIKVPVEHFDTAKKMHVMAISVVSDAIDSIDERLGSA